MPMTLVTLVLINVTDKRGLLYRVEDMSYPEKQAYEWHTRTKIETNVSEIKNTFSQKCTFLSFRFQPNLAVAEDVEKI